MSLADLLKLAGGDNTPTSAAPKRGPGRPKRAAGLSVKKAPTARSGKRIRRSIEDIQRVASKVTALLGDHSDGLSSEEIQKALGIAKKDLVGPLALGLNDGSISKTGERRATRYYAKTSSGRGRKKSD